MNEKDNPVAAFLEKVRSAPALQDFIAWVREPPGLYLAVALVALLIVLFFHRIWSSSESGQQKATDRKLRGNLHQELKHFLKMKDWRGVGGAYERLGDQKKALHAYRRGGHAREQAVLLLQMGERKTAKNILETGEVWDLLAKLCGEDGEFAQAAVALERAGRPMDAAEAYERAGDVERAARLYQQTGMVSKAGELMAKVGGRGAAELLEREVRTAAARGKGAAMGDDTLATLRRAIEIWAAEGEHRRAFALAVDTEQWKLTVPLATGGGLPPSPETADACVRGGAFLEGAEIYDQIGEKLQAAQIRAQHYQRRDELIEAARWFEVAEDWIAAADLLYGLGQVEKAAELYEKGGDLRQAAEMRAAAGNSERAAALYEQVGEFQLAAAAYAEAGKADEQAKALSAAGDHFKAGEMLKDRGLFDKAIAMLQQVSSDSADYALSRVLLGEIFLDKGDRASARAALEKATSGPGVSRADQVRGFYNLARLAEMDGEIARALSLYEQVNAESYGFRDVAMRIKAIKDGRPISAPPPKPGGSSMSANPPHLAAGQASGTYDRTVASHVGGLASAPAGGPAPLATGDRYELEEEVGRGGMGLVYRALDKTLGRKVAYKALPEDLKNHPVAAQNLLAEARSAAQLSHPNVVQVYDAGQDGRGYFIVMELVDGETFDKILRGRKISVSGAVNIGRQVCAALSHAHSRHIVHRDLKPSNLFWTKDKLVKLMDFGLARVYDEEVGSVQTRSAGTPYYMAPEQIRGDAISPATDIYALGCVLYELLCNRPPFTSGELTYHHVHTAPDDPRQYRSEVSEALSAIVLKCLEKEPEKRYQSAEEVGRLLASIK